MQTPRPQNAFSGLPLNTPITQMMDPAEAAKLSPNAAKLTKANLLELAHIIPTGNTVADLNITVNDIQTIEDAIRIHQRAKVAGAGLVVAEKPTDGGTSCCCCPCCCCCAVAGAIPPILPLA